MSPLANRIMLLRPSGVTFTLKAKETDQDLRTSKQPEHRKQDALKMNELK